MNDGEASDTLPTAVAKQRKKQKESRKSGRLSLTGLDPETLFEGSTEAVQDYYRTVVAPTVTESGVIDADVNVIWKAIREADFSWCSAVKDAAELMSGACMTSIGSTRKVVWADNDQTWQLIQVKRKTLCKVCLTLL
jgi:hypothetical protein